MCDLCACRLQALVDAGPTPPPGETGAKFIIRKDGRRINLAFLRDGASRALEVRWRPWGSYVVAWGSYQVDY